MSVAASTSITQRTSVPSQREPNNKSFHQLRASEVKHSIQQLKENYKFQLITAAGAIIFLLKVLGKANWEQNANDVAEWLEIPDRTLRYAINHLVKADLIGTRGEGQYRKIWWKQKGFRHRQDVASHRQDVASHRQDVASHRQDVASHRQDVANESPESIDIYDSQDSLILLSNYSHTSFRKEENFEFEIEEEESSQGEGVPESSVEPEEPIEEKTSHQNPGESRSSAAPPPNLNQHQAAGQSDPREKWLREKAPTLPKPIPPANIDRWVQSQLTEANWTKWEEDYRADSVGAVTHQAKPAGFDAKIAYLRAAGVELGESWSGTQLLVRVVSQARSLSAEEFMNEPQEALMQCESVNVLDVFNAWRSRRG